LRRLSSFFVRVLLFALAFALLEVWHMGLLGSHVVPDLASSLVGGVLIGCLLVWMSGKMRLRQFDYFVLISLVLFVVGRFSNYVEGVFFTTMFANLSVLTGAVVLSLVLSFVEGGLAAVLLLPESHEGSLFAELSTYFSERRWSSWVWRILLASVAYFPIYFFFGMLISPFVMPYYSDPSLGLKIPLFAVMIPVELFRGLLYVIIMLGVFSTIRAKRWTMAAIVGLVLYVPGGLVPLMSEHTLPPQIVPFHMIEIFADSIVYGIVLTRLLNRVSLVGK
jgi:hypothetical protein